MEVLGLCKKLLLVVALGDWTEQLLDEFGWMGI
jgi:hypothetical protein